MKATKKYKIQKSGDRYILLRRKSRWNILGFVVISVGTLGLFQFVDWCMSFEGGGLALMDFELWTWKHLGCFDNSELAVAEKMRDEGSQRSQVIEEYYL